MATINVRRLDDDVVERLKARAAANKRSLEGEVRHILETIARDDARARWPVSGGVGPAKTAGRPQTPAEELIREDRDFVLVDDAAGAGVRLRHGMPQGRGFWGGVSPFQRRRWRESRSDAAIRGENAPRGTNGGCRATPDGMERGVFPTGC